MRFRTQCCDRARWLLVAALVCAPLVASAQSQDESIQITWQAAAGPVVGYDVYVSVNGSAAGSSISTSDNEVQIAGAEYQRGDALRVQVVAVGADGRRGLPSEVSDAIFFLSPPEPRGVVANDGSLASPNAISWSPVDDVDFYVVFRSQDPGVVGTLLASATDTYAEDFGAALEVTYYCRVAAIKGRQVSEFSTSVAASRRIVDLPSLVASPPSLSYQASAGETSASQTLVLSNSGGFSVSFTAWPSSSWVEVTPSGGTVDLGGALTLQVTYSLESLSAGQHDSAVLVYTYYEPSPGAELVPGPLLVAPVAITVPRPNSAPVIQAPLGAAWVTLFEGEVLEVPFVAMDPDPGEPVDIGVNALPEFATFENFGGGTGMITLAPGYGSAGAYQSTLIASNPTGQTYQTLTVVVQNRNLPPVVAGVPDTTIEVGEQSTILIQALDPDGDRIAISSSALPDFATLTDLGNGTAVLSLSKPTADDVGTYLIVLAVVDDGTPSAVITTLFVLTVE